MPEKRLRIFITLLVGFLLFVGLLQFVPISISLGERCDDNMDAGTAFLQPGDFYLIKANKAIKVPDGMQAIPCGFMGAGFFHDGKRQDNGKDDCRGNITTLMQDNGDRKYRCEKCKKIWVQSPDNK